MSTDDTITVREHSTASIPFTLYADDDELDISSTSHVELNMIDSKKKVYRYSSDSSGPRIVVNSDTLGYITFTPPSYDTFLYDRSPYKLYCWVYETSGVKYSVPRDGYATIKVLREY